MAVIAGNIKKEAQAQFDKEINSPLLSDDPGNFTSLFKVRAVFEKFGSDKSTKFFFLSKPKIP